MNNEELCQVIKADPKQKNDLVMQLLDQNRGFIFKQAIKWATAFEGRPDFDLEDLLQSAYFAIIDAIERFEPGKGSFLCILSLTLKTAFSEAAGVRTPSQINEPLYNNCTRMECQISSDSDTTISETIPDPCSEEQYEIIERQIENDQLKQLIDKALKYIKPQQRTAIEAYYLQGKNLTEIGDLLNVSAARAQVIVKEGLKALRAGNYAADFSEFLYSDRNYYRGISFLSWKRSGCSIEEKILLHKENTEGKYDLKTAEGKYQYLTSELLLENNVAYKIAYNS